MLGLSYRYERSRSVSRCFGQGSDRLEAPLAPKHGAGDKLHEVLCTYIDTLGFLVHLEALRWDPQVSQNSPDGKRSMLSRITLRQLEYCIAAGDCGSVSEAAERIHVSPSSISSAIAHVESELGTQLFVRHHGQGLSIGPAGRAVLVEVRRLLDQTANLYSVAAEAQGSMRGLLRVGCFTTLAAMVAPELCQGFAKAHPGVKVTQIEDHHQGLIERLARAEIDIAITYDLEMSGVDFAFEPLASLPPYAIVGENHPLAFERVVTLPELAKLPMVMLDLPISRSYFMALFHAAGADAPLIAAETRSPEVVRSLVANSVGYSLVNVRPRNSYSLDGKRIVNVRVAGNNRPMKIGLAWGRDQQLRRLTEAFMHRCRTFISNEYVPGMTPPPPDFRPIGQEAIADGNGPDPK